MPNPFLLVKNSYAKNKQKITIKKRCVKKIYIGIFFFFLILLSLSLSFSYSHSLSPSLSLSLTHTHKQEHNTCVCAFVCVYVCMCVSVIEWYSWINENIPKPNSGIFAEVFVHVFVILIRANIFKPV